MAQPPLSQAIKKLEAALGVRLLDRTSRAVSPTPAGDAFAEGARNVCATLDLAVAAARTAGGAQTAIRIGCVPQLPINRLLRFLDALHEREPEGSSLVTHLESAVQLRRLREGQLDFGILHHAETFADVEFAPLFDGEPLAALLPPEHRLAATPILGPSDLEGETLVLFPRADNPALFDDIVARIRAAGYKFGSINEAGGKNPRDLVLAVAGGVGVSLAPASITEGSETSGVVVRRELREPVQMPETIVVWHAKPPRQPPAVIADVRAIAAELRGLSGAPRSPRGRAF